MTPAEPVRAEDRVRVAGTPVEREVGAKVFVLTPDSRMHVLDNDTAVFVWGRLRERGEEGESIRALGEAVASVFKVDAERAEQDVRAFVDDLLSGGVVERVD